MNATRTFLLCTAALCACVINLDDGDRLEPMKQVYVDAEDGGMVTSADGRFTLDIPAGALHGDTMISIRRVPFAQWPAEAVEGDAVADVYELLPEGLEFRMPATMTLTFAHDVAGDGAPIMRGMSLSDDGVLEPLGDSATEYYTGTDEAVFTSELEHFSIKWIQQETIGLEVNFDNLPATQPVEAQFAESAAVHNRGTRAAGDPDHRELLKVHALGAGKTSALEPTGTKIDELPAGFVQKLDLEWQCDGTPGRGSVGAMINHTKVVYTQHIVRTVSDSATVWKDVTCVAPVPPKDDPANATITDTDGGTDTESDTDATDSEDTGGSDGGVGDGTGTTGGVEIPDDVQDWLEECDAATEYFECVECCSNPDYEQYADMCEYQC